MHSTIILTFFAFLGSVFGHPFVNQKRYDLDNNGVPDFCWTGNDGIAHCMRPDGSWTAFPASSPPTVAPSPKPATSTKNANPVKTSTVSKAPQTSAAPVAKLPNAAQFAKDRGSKWKVDFVGDLKFTGQVGAQNLLGDKCRSSKIGDKVIWNCGDMQCDGSWQICGFAMGPAFYGTNDVMTVDTSNVVHVQDNDFLKAWSGDPAPVAPQSAWGMDTSNIAPVNDTHGIAYAWEIWRGASDGSYVDRGNAVAWVTLGSKMPIATRVGPLLTDGNAIQLGLLAILRDQNYIYSYSIGGPSNLIIGRVAAGASAFDAKSYEFLAFGSSTNWIKGSIPSKNANNIGATTANSGGKFGCAVYGSVFYNTYLKKYVIVCNIFLNYVNMYTSDTPYGPWSEEYQLMSSSTNSNIQGSYGSMVHAAYGAGKEFYLSLGPNNKFHMFKITLNY